MESVGHVGYKHDLCVILLSSVNRVRVRLCKLQKNSCTRLAAASDKVYQLLVYGRWFYLASSTTKTGTISVVSEDKI
jgi:hypothetical protein